MMSKTTNPLGVVLGTLKTVGVSFVLFVLAGLCEIGGGWLMWQWIRHGKGFHYAVAGAVLLVVYGVLPAFQPAPAFGRVYAAYGGVFVIMSLLWDWRFDGKKPDLPDFIGAALCLIGVCIIMQWPRK